MAKRTETAIKKVSPGFLADYQEDKSLETLRQHVEVPRLKLIQGTTEISLRETFGEGAGVIRPGDVLVCRKDDAFSFVPLFFFVEWCKWADMKDSSPRCIIDRTFNADSELAVKAKDFKARFELYEGHEGLDAKQQMQYRYVEHLRFISVIHGDHELAGAPLTISFERGEYRQGKAFINAIAMRREHVGGEPKSVPLWAQVWTLQPGYRDPEPQRKWWGWDYKAAEPAIIEEEEAPAFRQQHEQFKEAFEANLLRVKEVDTLEEERTATDEM
jgi:hypothetical protein